MFQSNVPPPIGHNVRVRAILAFFYRNYGRTRDLTAYPFKVLGFLRLFTDIHVKYRISIDKIKVNDVTVLIRSESDPPSSYFIVFIPA